MGSADIQGPLWSGIADTWAEVLEPLRTPLYDAMLDAADVKAGTYLLDAGCGSGAASKRAALRGAKVAGLDAAEGMIKRARQQVPDGDFRVGDLEELPFEANTFEAVVASDSVQYAENKVAAIAEMARVCKPSGIVVVAIWDVPEKNEQRAIFAAMENELPEPPRAGPFALSKHGLMEDMIKEAGLSVEGQKSVPIKFRFSNVDQFWQVVGSSGYTKRMMRVVGEERIKRAALAAVEQFIQPSGEVIMQNSFRYVKTGL